MLWNVLHFVDEYRQGCVGLGRSFADDFEKHLKIVFEIAVIGKPRFGFEIQTDLDIVIPEFECCDEPGKTPQRSMGKVGRPFVAGKLEKNLPKFRREKCRKRPRLGSFHTHGLNTQSLGIVA